MLNTSDRTLLRKNFRGDIKILLVDDDSLVRRVLHDIFGNDYVFKSVINASDFRLAVESFQPDIVLIDVLLPDGNGIELCEELRKKADYSQLSVIILTSFDDTASIEAAYRAGANDYIRKPFIPFEISSKIYQISKSINYQNGVVRLYNQQKITNERLYKLATLINRNIHIADKNELLSSLFQVSDFIHCDYCEMIVFSGTNSWEKRHQQYIYDFQYINYEKYRGKLRIFSDDNLHYDTFQMKRKDGSIVYGQIAKIFYNKKHEGYLILQKARVFAEESRDMLSLYLDFINILGVDLTSKDLMRNEIHKERRELAKVRSLQVSLLPHFEEIDKYDIASTFIPMEEISGDFFDGFYISENVYQIVICDVSGHGAASSYIGSSIRGLLRSSATFQDGPGDIIRRLNDSVVKNLSNIYYFSSLILCQLNIPTGEITLVSAGHPACFYYDGKNRQYERIENTGPLVGLIPDSIYEEKNLILNVGDCLFMYTDGIIEAPGERGGGMYGEERLFQCFQDNIERTSIDIVHTVVGTVYEHTGFTSLHDDATVICIKRIE